MKKTVGYNWNGANGIKMNDPCYYPERASDVCRRQAFIISKKKKKKKQSREKDMKSGPKCKYQPGHITAGKAGE